MSGHSKAQKLDHHLLERNLHLNSLKKPIEFQVKQLNKPHVSKKIKTTFSAR